jgi:transcriptional regulator with XRE-family HTH domain
MLRMKDKQRKPAKKPVPENPWPKRLKVLRDKLGLNQKQAAEKIHISQSQWSAFESGARTPTRPIAHLISLLESGKI